MMKVILAALTATTLAAGAFAQPAGTTHTVDMGDRLTLKPMVFTPITIQGTDATALTDKHKVAAVIVVPEWYGRNEFALKKAGDLANLGYVGIAWDMYGDAKVASSPQEAGKWSGALKNDRKEMRRRIEAAVKFAKSLPGVDSHRIGAIGFCFGGTTVLELARAGADVRGVVSFHGGLDAGSDVKTTSPISTKILVLHGADDPHVPPAQVDAFKAEMKEASADLKFVAYPGAVHSFTNPDAGNDPSKGAAYDAEAAEKSWQAMKDFLKETLAPRK